MSKRTKGVKGRCGGCGRTIWPDKVPALCWPCKKKQSCFYCGLYQAGLRPGQACGECQAVLNRIMEARQGECEQPVEGNAGRVEQYAEKALREEPLFD